MNQSRTSRRLAIALCIALLVSLPSLVSIAAPAGDARPVEVTLERLSDVLKTLEAELSALEAPRAERLEDGLEEIIELIANLLDAFDAPQGEGDGHLKARILRLDLMLHQLVDALEHLLADDDQRPARPGAQDALQDLRSWVDGYIEGMTAGLDPQLASRLEEAAHQMVRDFAKQLADLAKNAVADDPEHPKLERLLDQLNALVQRLDQFIRENFRPEPRNRQ